MRNSIPGCRGDGAVEHEVDDGPGGVEEELEHRPGTPERRVLPARRRRRVDEQPGAAPVELAEHRVEGGVAQVGPADVGEQREAVDVELVAAVGDLGHGGVDVGQRERGEQAEPSGMVDDGAPAGLVHLAGEVARPRRRRRGARRATRSTAATSRSRAGPSRRRAPRRTSPGSAGSRRAGRGRSPPAPPGSRRAGSGRGRRSSRRPMLADPVEEGLDVELGRSPCIEWPTSGNDR